MECFFGKLKSTYFYNDFHVHIVVWIFWSFKNVMYWIIILTLDFFVLYYEVQILVTWNDHESNVLMKYKVKYV
jgi:hypothetical protein